MKTTKQFVRLILIVWLSVSISKADFIFNEPIMVPNINSTSSDSYPQISRDGLELYFTSNRDGATDIWVSKRTTQKEPWSEPIKLDSPVNSTASDISPSLSGDGLELYFSHGDGNLWVSTRATKDDPWGEPLKLESPVNTENMEDHPCISADGLSLYFMSNRPVGSNNPTNSDIFVTTRPTRDDPWGEPVKLSRVNSSQYESTPFISSDGLTLFLSRGYSKGHVYASKRKSTEDTWGAAQFFGPINSGSASAVYDNSPGKSEFSVSFSKGEPRIYFSRGTSARAYDFDIWHLEVTPITDFNNDGIVNADDICIMFDYWHTNEPLYDIAPAPLGDGFVDIEDLSTLTQHLFTYPGTVANWKLEETEGDIAYDSVGYYDGILVGSPTWQAHGGIESGALQFDGIDDYVVTAPVLNPAVGEFSVYALIKGGLPGQVILSQTDNSNWLSFDEVEGNLMTECKESGRGAAPLISQTVVADDEWHQIVFVWDGSYRHLYVDGQHAAQDTTPLSSLDSANDGLYFGVGSDLASNTFFSGLVDDIRIYNRVISP